MELVNLKDLQNHLVVKSNELIEARYKLTLNEQKIMLILISQIKPEDEVFKIYSVHMKDLMEILDIDNKKYYSAIRKILKDLKNKELTINDLDVNWLASAEYKKNGIVEIEISQKLKPYLLQLKSHFTVFGLENVIKLKSIYSIRLYEILLKEYCYYGRQKLSFILGIKELKEMLGLGEKQYSEIITLKRYVLDVAEKELKEKSDFYFEYKAIKTGRAITDIEFFVINKDKKQKQLVQKEDCKAIIDINHSPVEEQETDEIIKRLIALGFQDYKKIRSEHSDEVLLNAFADLDFEVNVINLSLKSR